MKGIALVICAGLLIGCTEESGLNNAASSRPSCLTAAI